MQYYFVMMGTENGARIERLTGAELEKRLNENWWSSVKFGTWPDKLDTDPNYWGNSAFIVKGEVIVPKAVETVTKFKVT